MNKEVLAYMAGFVDGEGTITICSVGKGRTYTPKLSVVNTNYEAIELFKDHFGGKVRKRDFKNGRWKPCYEWTLTSKAACKVIEQLLPFLRIKHMQAILVLRLNSIRQRFAPIELRWDRKLAKKTFSHYEKLKTQCHELNKRGL